MSLLLFNDRVLYCRSHISGPCIQWSLQSGGVDLGLHREEFCVYILRLGNRCNDLSCGKHVTPHQCPLCCSNCFPPYYHVPMQCVSCAFPIGRGSTDTLLFGGTAVCPSQRTNQRRKILARETSKKRQKRRRLERRDSERSRNLTTKKMSAGMDLGARGLLQGNILKWACAREVLRFGA